MPKNVGPYIGVTGFMSRAEVNEAVAMIPPESKRRLMVGVLVSSITFAGETNRRYPRRYPRKENIAGIFSNNPRTLNLVHFHGEGNLPDLFLSQLHEVRELAGPNFNGFQFNNAWPSVSAIEDYWEIYPDDFLVLQIGARAMAEAGDSMERFADRVGGYLPMIDAILIDPSGGRGEAFNSAKCMDYLRAINSAHPTLGIVVASGLGPDTLGVLSGLASMFPDLSIDAESRLRTPAPEDALDMNLMGRYLWNAHVFFSKTSKA